MSGKLSTCVVLLAGMFVIGGCQMVSVKDKENKPIPFAKVRTTSKDKQGASLPVMTDIFGNVMLPQELSDPEKPQYLIINKEGYQPREVRRPKEGNIEVILQKSAGAITAPTTPAPRDTDRRKETRTDRTDDKTPAPTPAPYRR